MCGEGSCCGPCCSVRSWFVTHVVFVTLGSIGIVVSACSMLTVINAAGSITDTAMSINRHTIRNNQNGYNNGNVYKGMDSGLATVNNTLITIKIIVGLICVFRIGWSIVGWVTVHTSNAKMHKVYVGVFGPLDLLLNIIAVIGLMYITTKYSFLGRVDAMTYTSVLLPAGIHIFIMDIAPLICFCVSSERTLSKFSCAAEPGQVGVPAAGGPSVVYPGAGSYGDNTLQMAPYRNQWAPFAYVIPIPNTNFTNAGTSARDPANQYNATPPPYPADQKTNL